MTQINLARLSDHVHAAWEINLDRSKALTQVADDIWITDKEITPHVDPTADGYLSYGMVLLNDLNLELAYRGEKTVLRQGDVYEIDGRLEHAALAKTATVGLFSALIWDMPRYQNLEDFRSEAEVRVLTWLSEPPSRFERIAEAPEAKQSEKPPKP